MPPWGHTPAVPLRRKGPLGTSSPVPEPSCARIQSLVSRVLSPPWLDFGELLFLVDTRTSLYQGKAQAPQMCVLWRTVSFPLKGRAQRLFSGNGSVQSCVAPPETHQPVPPTSPRPQEEDASTQWHSPHSHLGRAQQVAAPGTAHSCCSPPGQMQSPLDLVQALVNRCKQVSGPRPLLLPPADSPESKQHI